MWDLGAELQTEASIFCLHAFPLKCIKVPINTLSVGSRNKERLSAHGE